jgi:hypothetical protein
MANLVSRLVHPWYPATAIGLEEGVASVVQLERVRGNVCRLKRAATFNIADSLLRPSFDERNIENPRSSPRSSTISPRVPDCCGRNAGR